MYSSGRGVPQDDAQAVEWYRKAADQGNADAQFFLASCYDAGAGVPRDYAQGAKWWRKAAEQGNAAAQKNLGWKYLRGVGVPQDYVLAHIWLNLAASRGVEEAVRGRDIAARRMTPAQIAEAQKLARKRKPTKWLWH
jgi:TPR repeat protein